jgi:hypothetical protein
MKKLLFFILIMFSFIRLFSQEENDVYNNVGKKYGISLDYYILNNSKYNTQGINFSYLNNYKVNSNFNINFGLLVIKEKFTIVHAITYQNFYASTSVTHDSVYGSNGYEQYEVIKYRNTHLIGLNPGIEKNVSRIHFNFHCQFGWYFYRIINDFSPESYYVGFDEKVLSQGIFFGLSGLVKYRIFKTEKFESLIRFSANERFLEKGPNFTIGLGLEFNLLK